MTQGLLEADIEVAGGLDGLIAVPRRHDSKELQRCLLANLSEPIRLSRRAEGIFVHARYAHLLLTLDSESLRWSADAWRFAQNRLRVQQTYPKIIRALRELQSLGASEINAQVATLGRKSVLDHHQRVNVAAMTLPEGFGLCLFDEQGAGKTVSFIYAFDLLVERDQADVALIISPLSMVPEWSADITRFTNGLYKVSLMVGTRPDKLRALTCGADIVVANFETIVSLEDELKEYLKRFNGRAVFAIDESFFIKTSEANRTRAAKRLREWCDRAYVLCGTPAPNSAHDLIEQFNFVDFGTTFAGVEVPKDRAAAKATVQSVISAGAPFIRHLKRDVLPDLPEKRFTKLLVPLEPVQKKIYEALLGEYVTALRSVDDVSFRRHLRSFLAKRSAMIQVCSHPASVVAEYGELPAKLKALDDIVRQLVQERNEKLVIWSFFRRSLSAIVERYSQLNPLRYDGSVTSTTERREAVRAFQEDNQSMLFVGNPAAAGAGLTLHRARYVVYESFSAQAAHYLQSLDRVHRRGQTRSVEYLVLLAADTLEMTEFERIERKELQAQELLGDSPEPKHTREAFLQEALDAIALIGASHA